MKRIGYIDALRGVTMILVVFSHLYIPNHSVINQLFINFRMPLFFFISGLISMRVEQSWDGEALRRRLGSKARTLLLPIMFFGLLYTAVRGLSLEDFLINKHKLGFWFTLVLFEMLGIYYAVRHAVAHRGWRLSRAVTLMLVTATAVSFLWSERWMSAALPSLLSLSCLLRYLPFFAFGLFAGYHRRAFDALIDRTDVYVGAVALFGALSWANIRWNGGIDVILCLAVGLAGIVMMYGMFRRLGHYFEDNTHVGRCLQYVGRHTLEVYVLHYFLLIGFGASLYPYVATSTFPLSPVVVGLPLATAIAVASLGLGRLLCCNKYIAYYALGKR